MFNFWTQSLSAAVLPGFQRRTGESHDASTVVPHQVLTDGFWEKYLSLPADARNPYAVPKQSNRLDGLPPTLILTTENEALRDEAEEYGQLLRAAGVDAHIERFDGLVHGVFWMSGAVPRSAELRSAVRCFIKDVVRPTGWRSYVTRPGHGERTGRQ